MPTKVLVADDSPTIRRRANATLGEAGYEVTTAEHGEAAWEALQGGGSFDVLLCDILMPELDGYELCARVKADERFRNLPVLLLRGTFEPWDQNRAEEVGADGFIAKPFDPESLVGTLQEVLEDAGDDSGDDKGGEEAGASDEKPAPSPSQPGASDADDPFGGGPPVEPPAAATSDDVFGDEKAEPSRPSSPAAPTPAPAASAAPVGEASSSAAGSGPSAADLDGLDDAALDRLAERLLRRMSTAKVEEIVWEVVPEVAEAMVRKRILEIESRLDG